MRNKGAVLTLAIALALVCLYQLSFTWKAVNIRKQVDNISKNDPAKKEYLLDSLSGSEVYNLVVKNFTFKEVQERELNFGLDLKGGMNVILEVSTIDVVRALSNFSKDSTFNRALRQATIRKESSQDNFIALFGEEFEKIDPNARLSAVFNSPELRDKVNYNTSNEDVLKIVRKEAQDAIDNAFNIIRTRIDQFGVTQPNLQKLESGDRILVELPGVKNKDRVRKLLQGTANLEFWETFENQEIIQGIYAANETANAYEKSRKELGNITPAVQSQGTNIDKKSTATDAKEEKPSSLLEQIKGDTTSVDSVKSASEENSNPLFSILAPMIDRETGKPYPGSVIGRAHFKDTTKINFYLRLAKERNVLPRNAIFLWSALPLKDQSGSKKTSEIYQLYAIKVTSRDGKAPLDGDAIVTASQEFDQAQGNAYVLMSMNGEGSKKWARITKENIGKVLCVVLDNRVYSDPVVQNEIDGGSTQITGHFSINEAADLANMLKSGKLPAPAHIVQEDVGQRIHQSRINVFFPRLPWCIVVYVALLWQGRKCCQRCTVFKRCFLVWCFCINGIGLNTARYCRYRSNTCHGC
jgi:SecD/SecF fusion protein